MATRGKNVSEVDHDEWAIAVEPFPETYSFENPGDTCQGKYLNSKTITQDGLDGNPREVQIHTLEDENGKKWGIWGSYNIDEAWKKIEPGMMVRVTYVDTVKIDNGARTVKQFDVRYKN